MWPETLDVEFVPSPERRGEWTHLQSSGGHCRDGSGSEDSDVCSIEKPRAGSPEDPDGSHLLSQAISCARWRRGNQHFHLEFLCFSISCAGDSVPRPSRPARRTPLPPNTVFNLLPKQLDAKVAELYFPAFGAALTVFAQEHPSSSLPDVVVFHEPVLLQLDLLTY